MAKRGYSHNGWDPTGNEYETQYPDDEISGGIQLDHCRLYITNIPPNLTEDGLRSTFSRYGDLIEAYLSRDPSKKYGLIKYETSGQAKMAMMKMNRMEPLKLNIAVARKARPTAAAVPISARKERPNTNGLRECGSSKEETNSVSSRGRNSRRQEDHINSDEMEDLPMEDEMDVTDGIDPNLHLELENLKLEQLKVKEEQLACKQRMILLKRAEKRPFIHNTSSDRYIMPDGKIIFRNTNDRSQERDGDASFGAGAGDSNETTVCSCKAKFKCSWGQNSNADEGSSTPSTCVLNSEDRSDEIPTNKRNYKDKSDLASKVTDVSKKSEFSTKVVNSKTTDVSGYSKTTSVTKKSNRSKLTDTISKRSDATSKKESKRCACKVRSNATCDLKYSDFYSESEDEFDGTNRLIQLRNSDYLDIVEDELKLVIALAGYPKSKMRLRQMEQFQRCLTDVIDMQLKASLLKKVPSFLDYYLNRGAIVCICKDLITRDWMVRISQGLQERMCTNLILLNAKVKRLCLAILKIPHACWPATAQDTFKLLQYFNPTIKTNLWKIYAQKSINGIECTSFLIDRLSGEIIRGPNFKNVIDYNQMEFELTGYTEIYYECLISGMEEDLSSVASRVKLLEELKSTETTPRNLSGVSVRKLEEPVVKSNVQMYNYNLDTKSDVVIDSNNTKDTNVKKECENSLQKDILKKLKDVNYVSVNDEVLVWSDETNNYNSDNEKADAIKVLHDATVKEDNNIASTSGIAVSDKTESIIESNDNLIARSSNLNIDSNRGIAYHRRTNYLHVENELKVAITLDGYPQNKLEGTHIRRLKHLFKEYLHKDMKMQRFANLIIPKFQDIYLSNGAVIYICDSLETKDYLNEVLPKFINSTGLKLTFKDIKSLVRYTRVVMRLPKEHAHVETLEILLKLQTKYPTLKPDCWKYYSDVAGKQKRQFGVDPESLEVIKNPNFDPTYEGEKLTFRIIDRQKRDVSFEETNTRDGEGDNCDIRKQRDIILKNMYVPIDPEVMNAPLNRIRTNHYSDLIADDLKLYVGPSNYPESRIDEVLFHSIKRTFENIVYESLEKGDLNDNTTPKFHDMYLFDGVIFIICQNMHSRNWLEREVTSVNSKLHLQLKSTEFRGAVGIISMVVKTDKDSDEIIATLQKLNPRLRTKYWRKISTVRTKTKLDIVLQIDKLSAQVITSHEFNKHIGANAVQFKLGHLQSLLKPKSSLEELSKAHAKEIEKRLSKTITLSGNKFKSRATIDELKTDSKVTCPDLKAVEWDIIAQHVRLDKVCDMEIDENSSKVIENEGRKVFQYIGIKPDKSDLDPIIIEPDSPGSPENELVLPENNQLGYSKILLKVPLNILPESKDDLNIIFDLLEDKNPGLNTELWQVFTDTVYPGNGRFTLFIDTQSVSVIQGKNFDPTICGERLKFYF